MHIFTYKDHSLVIDRPVLVSFLKAKQARLYIVANGARSQATKTLVQDKKNGPLSLQRQGFFSKQSEYG